LITYEDLRIKKADNANRKSTKIVQRVPVKINKQRLANNTISFLTKFLKKFQKILHKLLPKRLIPIPKVSATDGG